MNLEQLTAVAKAMVAPGKGILAADESNATIRSRFDAIGVDNTPDNRRDYRSFMFRTEPAMTDHVSGVILFDETIRQHDADGTPLVQYIKERGAIPGIKVDQGPREMAGFPAERCTDGMDGLRDRLRDYYAHGARFAKWRAVIDVSDTLPTAGAVKANAHMLARYAALCQEENIVPIVEPEVLMDGAHTIERCAEVTEFVLKKTFQELFEMRVQLEGIVLKPNMIVAGKKCPVQPTVAEVAEKTVQCLKHTVPSLVPGIAFLSGGQSDIDATAHLDAMNKIGGNPWPLTFSYGRALQAAAQKAWSGKPENVSAGQAAFAKRARMNSLASLGQWDAGMEAA
ncbi:MAG: fructose-bisphosphate aldolase class I [Hyphomonadaceae bacterium]|jgi:fructose-bisphosphate aldolase class I|nr:fructose-bisphosphate aldolase class I [Hyphomonadaceae bacterium]